MKRGKLKKREFESSKSAGGGGGGGEVLLANSDNHCQTKIKKRKRAKRLHCKSLGEKRCKSRLADDDRRKQQQQTLNTELGDKYEI